jgi:hypothetical protein
MAKDLDTSDSNNILKTILIILIVAGIAYLVYYLYNQSSNQNKGKVNMSMPVQVIDQETQEIRKMPVSEESISNVSSRMSGSPSGQQNPIMQKMNTLPNGRIIGQDAIEHFSTNQDYQVERNLTNFPKDQLTAEELLPQDNSSLWAQVNPSGEGSLKDRNFLQSGYHIGINTVGQTLRNANLQLRSEPPCPQVKVSPWLQATIEPDVSRKPFEIGGCA